MYETYEHQNQRLIMPKLAPINLVLPEGKLCRYYKYLPLHHLG